MGFGKLGFGGIENIPKNLKNKAKEAMGWGPRHGISKPTFVKPEGMSEDEFKKHVQRFEDFYYDDRTMDRNLHQYSNLYNTLIEKLRKEGVITSYESSLEE